MIDFTYIEPQELCLKLKNTENKAKDIIIVDVREDDFIGGHIKGALHIPSYKLSSHILNLVEETKKAKEIIFYCSFSQQRGPAGARLFLVEQQKIHNIKGIQEKTIFPKVYVLRGGFVEWQKKYGNDEKLTDKYNKELWEKKFWI
ncbi:hypothetical protein PNEG_03574 [Pneumocystis murina B123]|uniref:Rhodanese domain-containing protein n=1 Tax=Pneumocystis murina (strain B123) TaxID=1069680 RepID=M7NLW8_PNEMU|nr:hypothetical protein PNEG_03574 [Pneumocystis murina B123]EMR08136.1 hypothetical protein PNEG_03574 [Pneumocystis murina B123]